MSKLFKTAVFALTMAGSLPAAAYVGPGAGISVLGSLLGILATIVLAIGAIIMWPLRKMLKRKKAARAAAAETTSQPSAD